MKKERPSNRGIPAQHGRPGGEPTPSIAKQLCVGVRKDGQPCHAPATSGDYCPSHDPALRERMAEARRQGGKNRSRSARAERLVPSHLKPVYGLLAKALVEVYESALDPRQATALASLAGAMVKVLTSGELEERVRMLEAAAPRSRGRGVL